MKRPTTLAAIALLSVIVYDPLKGEISDDIQMLKQQVQELQKQREEDRREIERLREQLELTGRPVNGEQKSAAEAEAAAKFQQPVYRIPEELAAQANFVITGFADTRYTKTERENGSFVLGTFSPVFLFRMGDRALFEGELEISLSQTEEGESETEVELEYAQIDYAFSDNLTGIAGRFLSPLGTFPQWLHAAWINKLPTVPLPYEDSIVPFSQLGAQARGAFPLGRSRLNYALFLSNGPGSRQVEVGPDTFEEQIEFDQVFDNNGTVAGGGRLGFVHSFSAYHDFEVGLSGAGGPWNEGGDLMWSAFIVDATFHWTPNFEVRGEYIRTWQETADQGTVTPTGWWVQAAYKLAGLERDWPLINNLELVFRYSFLDTDDVDTKAHQYAIGLNYYLTNTLQIKTDYEFAASNSPAFGSDRFNLQLAYGF